MNQLYSNLRINLLSALCCALLWNCTHEAINQSAPQKVAPPYEVSLDKAVLVSQRFNLNTTDSSGKSAKVDATIAISTKETVNDEYGQPLFHVINYNLGGFIIVSADLRTMPILGYSSSGNKFDTKNALSTNGLGLWYYGAMSQMKALKKSISGADSIVIKEWKKYLKGDIDLILPKGGRVAANTLNTNTNCQAWYTTGQYMCRYSSYFSHNSANPNVAGPLFSAPEIASGIKWGQSRVANMYAPSAGYPACTSTDNASYCGRYPAGCGPVAMAQVLWYFNQSNSNYASMPSSSNGTPNTCDYSDPGSIALASLMINCGNSAESYYGFFDTCNTLTIPGKIPAGLQNMGLSNGGTVSSFTPSQIENELYQGYPVILFATNSEPAITGSDRHIWVCDGFDEHKYSEYNCDTGTCDQWSYLYLYFNWGFNGTSNGWYATGNFAPNPPPGSGSYGNYNQNVQMISGIRR